MGVKAPVSSEERTDSASSTPAPYRRSSPSAKTAGSSVHSNFICSRLSIMKLPCMSSTAPLSLGKSELIRKGGCAGWALASAAQILRSNQQNEHRARGLVIHGPAHRGADGAAMPTDEDYQELLFQPPREGGLPRCLGTRSHCYCRLNRHPPTEEGGGG